MVCTECKGTGTYVGLFREEPCKACGGSGKLVEGGYYCGGERVDFDTPVSAEYPCVAEEMRDISALPHLTSSHDLADYTVTVTLRDSLGYLIQAPYEIVTPPDFYRHVMGLPELGADWDALSEE